MSIKGELEEYNTLMQTGLDYAQVEEMIAETKKYKKEGEATFLDIAPFAKEVAVKSLAVEDRIIEIIRGFCYITGEVMGSIEQNSETSLIKMYHNFDKLFEEHFYRKASVGAAAIKQMKTDRKELSVKQLLGLGITKHLFNIEGKEDIEQVFEGTSRTLLSNSLDQLKSKPKTSLPSFLAKEGAEAAPQGNQQEDAKSK